jgi:transglutaminase-like putative cysteine protease
MSRVSVLVGGLAAANALLSSPQVVVADAPAWMHEAANAPLPAHDEKTSAVLVYSEDITTVMPDGKTKAIERRAYKILRPEGREYGAAHAFIGGDTKLGSMRAWCIPKQGKDYEVRDKDAIERSLGVQGGELITDLKVRTLEIPAAEAGNVVGYEIEYQSRPYVLEDRWWIQRDIPVREARYTLQLPAGWEYKAVWINHSTANATALGNNQWSWVVNDLPALQHERRMPPVRSLAAQMIVSFLAPGTAQRSGFLTWNDMGKWQAELARGRRDSTPEINQKVAELTKGPRTPEQKMLVITGFVQQQIRYVGIELGIGGWQPHAAADVFAHRYGDCKDKVTLTSTMLQQAGIDSYYVFINTLRGAVGPETPPMMFLFNHAILAIKLPEPVNDPRYQAVFDHPRLGRLLIFDPTDEKTPIGQIRGELQGNYGLLVTPDAGELVQMPLLPSASTGITRSAKLTLDAQGTLRGEVSDVRKGDLATLERHAQLEVQSSKDRVKRIEQEVSHSIGMFEITVAKMLNLEATDLPFGYTYTFVAPAYAKQIGSLLAVRPRVMGILASDILETKEPRQYPVVFRGPEKDADIFEITLPAGYEVDDLPQPADADYSFASYHSKTEVNGGALKYTRTFEVKELSIPVSKVEELRKLYRIIASDERSTVVLKPTAHSFTRCAAAYAFLPKDRSFLAQHPFATCFERPDRIGAANQERSKAQHEHRMTQARAKILPKGRTCPGIVGRKKQREHENQPADARGPHQNSENERDANRQFSVRH